MKTDIRMMTCLVIEKDGEFLTKMGTMFGGIGWDVHLSNAWKTRNKKKAMRKASEYGGTLMLFNPIVWRLKRL